MASERKTPAQTEICASQATLHIALARRTRGGFPVERTGKSLGNLGVSCLLARLALGAKTRKQLTLLLQSDAFQALKRKNPSKNLDFRKSTKTVAAAIAGRFICNLVSNSQTR